MLAEDFDEGDSVIVGYLELVGGAVRSLTEDLKSIESRQLSMDRRLAELGGLYQGLQEEILHQSPRRDDSAMNEQVQQVVATQRRIEQDGELNTCLQGLSEGWTSRLETLCQQQGRWLLELSADVAALQNRHEAIHDSTNGKGRGCTELALPGEDQISLLQQRMTALEQGQKTVAVGARRALHTALVVHQQQQSKDHEHQWDKCLDSLPVAELEQQCVQRFTEQDERLDKVLQMVDSLTDRFLLSGALSEGRADRAWTEKLQDLEAKLREKLDTLEAGLYGLASDVEYCRMSLTLDSSSPTGSVVQRRGNGSLLGLGSPPTGLSQLRDSLLSTVDGLDHRLTRGVGEVDQRISAFQEGFDTQRLALRQLSQQMPEISQKLEQLWEQCQYYFPKVKEHDVHVSFIRSSFESHKQSMLDQADGLESRERRPNHFTAPTPVRSSHAHHHPNHQDCGGQSAKTIAASEQVPDVDQRSKMLDQILARLRSTDDSSKTPSTDTDI